MSILERLTENVVARDVRKEGQAMLDKWEKTGLLEGLKNDYEKQTLAVLLENQAKELLREASTMAGGNVEGFAAVAFPIVRRVFGGLIANDLVSVQPMSLPSGLVFFLDFTFGSDRDQRTGESIYGGGIVGSEVTAGADIGPGANEETGFYNLREGYTGARHGLAIDGDEMILACDDIPLDGALSEIELRRVRFDADLADTRAGGHALIMRIETADLDTGTAAPHPYAGMANSATAWDRCKLDALTHLNFTDGDGDDVSNLANIGANARLVRRLTRVVVGDGDATMWPQMNVDGTEYLELTVVADGDADADFDAAGDALSNNAVAGEGGLDAAIDFQVNDNLTADGVSLGALVGTNPWQLEDNGELTTVFGIPEIDIRVDSTAITSATRKLKARWTPELAQDLNAYHNLDAEVELTGILSEQIALEIDQEILGDLLMGATAATLYWSRRPGMFVNRATGADITANGANLPDFTGTVSEWYETLVETINDVSADIHRKTLRGGANFLVTGPEVANILEFTSGFRASMTHDDDKGTVGAVNAGSINKKWDVWIDPYFPRNVILVGRKGSSFLESGYVYAPYVPLQVTPTIFDPDDFTPRKAVMCRYGKLMVKPDFYGLCIIRHLQG
jgi:hypothetical protein